MSLVSFVNLENDTFSSYIKSIRESLNLIDFSLPRQARKIVIKPNLCYYWDRTTGQTTDPKFIAALIRILQEENNVNSISIVESDASAMKCKHAFRFLGYQKIAKEYNVSLVNLTEDEYEEVEVKAGTETFKLRIPSTIQNSDLRINVPKIKYTMEKIEITCALKNIFGCNPYPRKFQYHSRLEETIVAINKAMKFDLCLLDGNIVSGIKPQKIGLVMASRDPVAIDVAAAKIAGVNFNSIGYIKLAYKEGLGNISFTQKGESLEKFISKYPKKTFRNKLMNKAYSIAISSGLGKRLGVE